MEIASDKSSSSSTPSNRRERRLQVRRMKSARRTGANKSTTPPCLRLEEQNFAVRCISSDSCDNLEASTGAASSTRKSVQTRPLTLQRIRPIYGVTSVVGKRREMEDPVMVAAGFTRIVSEVATGHEYDFFAVYDGHGGAQVAHNCRDRMHMIIAEEVARRWKGPESVFKCWEDTMMESFRRADAEVAAISEPICGRSSPGLQRGTVGSTALVAVVGERTIVVANCGVSRAVLSRGGRAMALSSDHKPNRPDEMQRIEQAGGKVIEWDGYRVCGILATSRSIGGTFRGLVRLVAMSSHLRTAIDGDHYLKPWVTCLPEVTVLERLDEDEFLILASDGIWDVISNEMACKIVRTCLQGRSAHMPSPSLPGPLPADAATLLTQVAFSRGSSDNISVVVVQLSSLLQN